MVERTNIREEDKLDVDGEDFDNKRADKEEEEADGKAELTGVLLLVGDIFEEGTELG